MAHFLTIHQLLEQLRAGELSSREATQACLDRVETVDGRRHAFISVDATEAMAQADAADQSRTVGEDLPMLGVPVAVKDVLAVKDQPLNCASKILGEFNSPYDATVIQKLRAAGAVQRAQDSPKSETGLLLAANSGKALPKNSLSPA